MAGPLQSPATGKGGPSYLLQKQQQTVYIGPGGQQLTEQQYVQLLFSPNIFQPPALYRRVVETTGTAAPLATAKPAAPLQQPASPYPFAKAPATPGPPRAEAKPSGPIFDPGARRSSRRGSVLIPRALAAPPGGATAPGGVRAQPSLIPPGTQTLGLPQSPASVQLGAQIGATLDQVGLAQYRAVRRVEQGLTALYRFRRAVYSGVGPAEVLGLLQLGQRVVQVLGAGLRYYIATSGGTAGMMLRRDLAAIGRRLPRVGALALLQVGSEELPSVQVAKARQVYQVLGISPPGNLLQLQATGDLAERVNADIRGAQFLAAVAQSLPGQAIAGPRSVGGSSMFATPSIPGGGLPTAGAAAGLTQNPVAAGVVSTATVIQGLLVVRQQAGEAPASPVPPFPKLGAVPPPGSPGVVALPDFIKPSGSTPSDP